MRHGLVGKFVPVDFPATPQRLHGKWSPFNDHVPYDIRLTSAAKVAAEH